MISDSSAESEAEDPLMPVPYKDMTVGGAQGVTSSLQYQYCLMMTYLTCQPNWL